MIIIINWSRIMENTNKGIFKAYTDARGLKKTRQRAVILNSFLAFDRHMSIDDLYQEIRKKNPSIGYATVSRTVKLFAEAGIAREVDFGDGQLRYEQDHRGEHHDHLVCTGCGAVFEFVSDAIEKIQGGIARRHGFLIETHRLELYGLCAGCGKRQASRGL